MAGQGVAVPVDVAALIVRRQHERGRSIDKMQLQKLLYLVQGAHHALWGSRAMSDDFRAYKNGPVIRPVEQTYADLVPGADPLPDPPGGRDNKVPESVQAVVELVLDEFGEWPAKNLEKYTKRQGTPWRATRGDLGPDDPSSEVIPDEMIAQWFGAHGVNPNPPRSTGTEQDLLERIEAGDKDALAELL